MRRSILIIDDSAATRKQIRSVLTDAGLFDMFYEASDGLTGFKEMVSSRPDIVICDLFMPESDGFKFLKLKKSHQDLNAIPVLVVANKKELNNKFHILEEGAQDYVTKPFTPIELIASVKSNLKIKILQDELVAAQKKLQVLETLSNIDPLTGLYNRRFFVNALEKEFERLKRYNRTLSLLMIDMDHFKSINDKCGHPVGDRVLTVVSRILTTGLRRMDVCARYGGDEFITMLPETDKTGAVAVAQRYLNNIREYAATDICGKIKNVSCSIGIAYLPESAINSISEFLKSADEALYISKNTGRNKISLFDSKSYNT
ncbi:MAG: diguanylate cyclase [Deltaproteobacteria bacterium]|nr:diguanylate cyclase [Deltaproteobacteria bacterium]